MKALLIGASVVGTALITQTPHLGQAGPSVELDGLIRPFCVVDVTGAADGLLETIDVDRGDRVEQGQTLATLDFSVERAASEVALARSQLDAELQIARVHLEDVSRRLERHEALRADGILSAETLEEICTQERLARLAVLQAEENRGLADLEYRRSKAVLARGIVESPISGVVMERFLSPGELVSRSSRSVILRLAQLDPLRVEVQVPIELLGEIEVGMEAEILPEDPVGGTFLAQVRTVDRVLDAASGTFGVVLELGNSDYRLPAGLRCKLRFER